MATAEAALAALESIAASTKATQEMLATIAEHLGVFRPKDTHQADSAAAAPTVAADGDLDGKYGNLPIKAKDPRDWTGESQIGKRPSECPPEYLDLCASRADYFASIETDAKKLRYTKLDASRWRGWAARLRNGWKPPVDDTFGTVATSEPLTADEVPF